MNKTFKPGDIVAVTFLKERMILRCVENWTDQLLLTDEDSNLKIAPIGDCELIERRDPPARTTFKRR